MTSTVEDYIAAFPHQHAARLNQLRQLIGTVLPEAREEIKWGTPAYSTGTVLVTFAGFTQHLNLYLTPSALTAFRSALAEYKTGKSAISLSYDQPLPQELITDILHYRRDEYANDGITWM